MTNKELIAAQAARIAELEATVDRLKRANANTIGDAKVLVYAVRNARKNSTARIEEAQGALRKGKTHIVENRLEILHREFVKLEEITWKE